MQQPSSQGSGVAAGASSQEAGALDRKKSSARSGMFSEGGTRTMQPENTPGLTKLQSIEDVSHERESPDRQHLENNSKLSHMSQMTRTEQMNELITASQEIQSMIIEDEWHNIPACVYNSTRELIRYQEILTNVVIRQAQLMQKTTDNIQENNRKFEHQTRTHFDIIQNKHELDQKKTNEKIKQSNSDNKMNLGLVSDQVSNLSDLVKGMKATLEVWDGKIRRVDGKIASLVDLGDSLQDNGIQQKKDFEKIHSEIKQMFVIPGVIGSAEEDLYAPYRNLGEFIKDIRGFQMDKYPEQYQVIQNKIKASEKRADKLVAELKQELTGQIKHHTSELAAVSAKITQLDEDLEQYIQEDKEASIPDEEDEEGSVSRSSRRSKSQSNISRHKSEHSVKEAVIDEPPKHVSSRNVVDGGKRSSRNVSRTNTPVGEKEKLGKSSFHEEDSQRKALERGLIELALKKGKQPDYEAINAEVEKIMSERHQSSLNVDQQKSVHKGSRELLKKSSTLVNEAAQINAKLDTGNNKLVQKASTSILVDKLQDTIRSKPEDQGPAISVAGLDAALTDAAASKDGKFRARRGSAASSHRSRPSSHRSRRSSKQDKREKSKQTKKGGKKDVERRKTLRQKGGGGQTTVIAPANQDLIDRIDELLEHQIRQEQQTEQQITALRDMVTAFSKAMWENQDPSRRGTGKSNKVPNVKRLDSKELSSSLQNQTINEESKSSGPASSEDESSVTASKQQTSTRQKQSSSEPQQVKSKKSKKVSVRSSRHQVALSKQRSIEQVVEDIDNFYRDEIAEKSHFVEAYVKEHKNNDPVVELFSMGGSRQPSRKSSLHQLFSANHESSVKSKRNEKNMLISEHPESLDDQQNLKLVGSSDGSKKSGRRGRSKEGQLTGQNQVNSPLVGDRRQTNESNQLPSSLESKQREGDPSQGGDNVQLLNVEGAELGPDGRPMTSQASQASMTSARKRQMNMLINSCPRCKGASEERPCQEWVDLLKVEFMDYIKELFREKMNEFIAFLEEDLTVNDQIDVDQDHVIHAFYREHNTLKKMNENFRLLEYKRKKYIEKRKKRGSLSPSPPKTTNTMESPGVEGKILSESPNTNKHTNFMTNLNKSSDIGKPSTLADSSIEPSVKNAFQRFAERSEPLGGVGSMYRSIQVESSGRTGPQVQNSSEMRRGSARQTSQPSMYQAKSRKQPNLMQGFVDLKPSIEITSSGTTQRRRPANIRISYDNTKSNLQAKQKFPIISTRKAHLTIDQRVWDAHNLANTSRVTFPDQLQNVPTLRQALDTNSSGGLMPDKPPISTHRPFEFIQSVDISATPGGGFHGSLINQDSAQNMTAQKHTAGIQVGRKVQNFGNQNALQPLAVQFQEFKPR